MRPSPRARSRRWKAALATWGRPVGAAVSGVGLALFASWAALAHAVPFVADHDYFRLRSIRISSDETRVPPQVVAEIAGLWHDTSLWDVDPEETSALLRDASWVREARVSRRFPWQVSVSVTRRHPVAATVASGSTFAIDADGVLFREVEGPSAPDLPYLTGWDLVEAQPERARRMKALLGVLQEAARRGVQVSELHMDRDETVWLYAIGAKAAVRLGHPDRAATGFERLRIALAELGDLADRARLIDTDYEGRIVIRGADDKLPALLAARKAEAAAPVAGDAGARGAASSTPVRAARHG